LVGNDKNSDGSVSKSIREIANEELAA